MTFLSVLLALILEQKRALPFNNPVTGLLRYHALRIRQALDVGKSKYEAMAWLSVALPWTLAAALIYIALYRLHFLFAFAWNVVILYFTLGFRKFSHHFTDIQRALNHDDIGRARETLHIWTGIKISDMPASEIVRQTLAHAVIAVHRHVFGVFFWFLMPLGPAGAVLYRIAETLARTWSKPSGALLTPHDTNAPPSASFSRFAQRAFYWIDWLPARLTAFGFAVVGNFEDAVHTWRTLRQPWIAANDTVLATVGGGALGAPLTAPHTAEYPDMDALPIGWVSSPLPDATYSPAALQRAAGLVWRAVVLWMVLLLMLTCAVWLG
ncbi:adenosylcobinamide-phosphate synthase,CbiB/CobD [Candidatus Glomeribacter gigasporarum BEG34]|uniref:Cobalamin biosynthesis protein CobD n=1 Tax=Candidatus Glomeribacter gigasporarum BEG34 TaxID=1070319 RepID=G2J942_9BURK|nr:CobD/CbiB family protein [Candidatus Glomeribacter gigasporarum]CCD29289.1 adenosylcobinamide-phosphate synthase,CbiB/CobD [Candidatus Glomeribacter gigasporarum BEG34]